MKCKPFLLVTGLVLFMMSCKKDSDPATCSISISSIAATYKVTKVESITAGITLDISSTFLSDPCISGATYKLNADKSMVYTEPSACGGDGTGTWDINNGNLSINQSGTGIGLVSAPINSFDCTNLVVTTLEIAGSSFRYTFTKQ